MFLLQDFFPWVRAGSVTGEAMRRYVLGMTLFQGSVSPADPHVRLLLGLDKVLGLWEMPARPSARGGGDVIPLGCGVPFLRREETFN